MHEIETERLQLRMFTVGDADDYYERIFGDPEVMRYLRGARTITRSDMPGLIERIHGRWRALGLGFWAVVDRRAGRLIGHVGLKPLDTTAEIEVAYALAQSQWGQGFATEAAGAALRFGFEQARLDRIVAVAVPQNTASRRVMAKIGMTYEKIGWFYGGDLAYYAIERDVYESGISRRRDGS